MGLRRECRQEVLKQMAKQFAPQFPSLTHGNWGEAVTFDEEGASALLGIKPAEVVLLCRTGIIPSAWSPADGTSITGEAMLTFLEENAAWWYRLRWQTEIASLREWLERAKARRNGNDKLHRELIRKALLATSLSMGLVRKAPGPVPPRSRGKAA